MTTPTLIAFILAGIALTILYYLAEWLLGERQERREREQVDRFLSGRGEE